MRLIDADALKKAIEQGEGFSWDSHGKDDLCVRKKYIDNAPTVENTINVYPSGNVVVQKRPQGEWIFVSRNCWKCPCCQELTNEGKNFCPNCGADMRGGAE